MKTTFVCYATCTRYYDDSNGYAREESYENDRFETDTLDFILDKMSKFLAYNQREDRTGSYEVEFSDVLEVVDYHSVSFSDLEDRAPYIQKMEDDKERERKELEIKAQTLDVKNAKEKEERRKQFEELSKEFGNG